MSAAAGAERREISPLVAIHDWGRTIIVILTILGTIVYQDRRVTTIEITQSRTAAVLDKVSDQVTLLSERVARMDATLAARDGSNHAPAARRKSP